MSCRGREGKKERRLKSYEFVYGHFFEVSQQRFNTFFFLACVCIYKCECVCMCVYTSCSIMSLACVRKCIFLQASVGVCVCRCGCVHIFGRLAGESLSYLIFISDSGND